MSGQSGREHQGDKVRAQKESAVSALQQKKRHSGHGGADSRTIADDQQPSSSKVRKLARAQALPASTSTAESVSRRSTELRFLTDFFPEQDQSRPLTRSRTKGQDSKEHLPTTSKSATSTGRRGKSKKLQDVLKLPSPSVEDQQLSNLTVPESEASSFSLTSTLTTDTTQTFIPVVESREAGNSNDSVFAPNTAVIMSSLPQVDAESTEESDLSGSAFATGSANQSQELQQQSGSSQNLARSQHVQRASAFLGSLVPRMQHLLGGMGGSSHASAFGQSVAADYVPHLRIMSLLDELRSENEIRQSEACSEISEMLLLGNEESLPNFPIREVVLCLVNLLNKDHNFELMLSASRCISNLQEALPRSHSVLVEAIPVLLQKLKRIEYIEVAEQALVILEVISRRNAKNILAAHGVQAVISHVDFFSMPTQRLAFQVAANCAGYIGTADFHMVQDCLADLTQRLQVDDKRCVESICTFFNRLVENTRYFPHRLRQIAGKNHELLQVFQQLLSTQPLPVSFNTFTNIIKSLRYMCTNCGDLAVALFCMDFGKTLRFLLIGNDKKDFSTNDIISRPAQHLREIVDLCGELLPRLPANGVFEVNALMEQYVNPSLFAQNSRNRPIHTNANWLYRSTDAGSTNEWVFFPPNDQISLERNRSLGAAVMTLEMFGQLCEVDFGTNICKFMATGMETPIIREEKDKRDDLKRDMLEMLLEYINLIFPLLVDIGSNSTCGTLKYDCMRVMLRMVHSINDRHQLLSFLEDVPLAAYISNTFSSSKNLALVALALQMTHLLLEKLPDLYIPLFDSEGVFYEMSCRANCATTSKKDEVFSDVPSTSARDCTRREAVPASPSTSIVTGSPAVAALGRLLAVQQNHSAQNSVLNQHLGLSSGSCNVAHYAGLALPLPTVSGFAVNSNQAYDPSHPNVIVSTSSLAHSSLLRYSADSNLAARALMPNSFMSVSGLSGPAASLYQSLHNAVTTYSSSVYGLNYAATGSGVDFSGTSLHSSQTSTQSTSSLKCVAAEQLESFISKECAKLYEQHKEAALSSNKSANMTMLCKIVESLQSGKCEKRPLLQLVDVIQDKDLSAFHINHSNIIPALTTYLTDESDHFSLDRNSRLRQDDGLRPQGSEEHFAAFKQLVSKVLLAVERIEQFNVRVTNLSGNVSHVHSSGYGSISSSVMPGLGSTYLRGAQALRFFQSHQIRCNLRRHTTCKVLREWRRGRGSIKVDPFTSISAIERYLIDRGIGTSVQDEESSENDDDTPFANSAVFKGRIEILIGDNTLPSEMSILQAIRQFALPQEDDDQETIPPSIWIAGHTLYYRAVVSEESAQDAATSSADCRIPDCGSASPSRKMARIQRSSTKKAREGKQDRKHKDDKKDRGLYLEGKVPKRRFLLEQSLACDGTGLDDPSKSGLILLKALHGLNCYWWTLYVDKHELPSSYTPILADSCFVSQKLNSKVSRQLSDFLTVATQQIPSWTKNLVKTVPFVFNFSTRRNFLYCTAFGRDRALMHLVNEANPDDHDSESTSRLVPRLERRKVAINRSNLLKDAQQVLSQVGSAKPLLEVGFEGEVGTGFGPTLEFYSTLSRELQKACYKLWHGSTISVEIEGVSEDFVEAENGLFPGVMKHSTTSCRSQDSRAKRFEFIGRLLAQTLLDSRILDIPFAVPIFKWILGEQDTLGVWDFEDVEPVLYNSLVQLARLPEDAFGDMDMKFTYPGLDGFELVKGGKVKDVTRGNLRQFIDLVTYWRLVEGVRMDMEALRKGFQQVVNVDHLKIFDAKEMESLFCGNSEKSCDGMWSKKALQQAIRPDHGYSHDSQQISWLVEMLEGFNLDQRRKFLQFVTGSPRLPVGGFRALHPPLTVVRKTASYGSADQELPSAMTCYNYLKIPPYESFEIFKERFEVALQYIYSFHLT